MDAQGNIYGVTFVGGAYGYGGGNNGYGTVWEIAKGTNTITTLASFSGSNGSGPLGTLTMDANGNLFGTTQFGGSDNVGTVFMVAKGSDTITTLASSNGLNGAAPLAGVTLDANDNLFGTTWETGYANGGTVFEITKGSNTITTLVSFDNYAGGAYPFAGVTLGPDNSLYGTTNGPGAVSGDGTVFEFSLSVPEPSTMTMSIIALALVGAATVLRGRRRSPDGLQ